MIVAATRLRTCLPCLEHSYVAPATRVVLAHSRTFAEWDGSAEQHRGQTCTWNMGICSKLMDRDESYVCSTRIVG